MMDVKSPKRFSNFYLVSLINGLAQSSLEGMQEGEAMPESEAAATTTGEDSLEEAGGGPGAAGRSPSPGFI